MCASGVAAIATKIHANRPDEYLDLTCGVDGSVYKKHPTFSKFLQVLNIKSYQDKMKLVTIFYVSDRNNQNR